MSIIATVKDLEAIYGQPNEASTVKVSNRITPSYRVLIDKSPFAIRPPRPIAAASRAVARCVPWT
jgi:predicted pyridoxine 5'-phosphate oxidase superfamily flavin-nucleotide-binding protein